MKKIFLILVLLQIIILLESCELIIPCRDTDFTIVREENNSIKLNLAGYYYGDLFGGDTNSVNVFLFYQNGVTFDANSKKTNEAISGNISLNLDELAFDYKSFWGIYKITNDSIEIQHWIPQLNGCCNVAVYKGKIINDTTFNITHWYAFRRHGIYMNIDTLNVIFKFHKYSPKPDSVVSFIP